MQNYSQADPYEREPLDSTSRPLYDSPSRGPAHSHHHDYEDSQPPYYDASPSRYQNPPYGRDQDHQYVGSEVTYSNRGYGYDDDRNPTDGPVPPPHTENTYYHGARGRAMATGGNETVYEQQPALSTITPGADNFSDDASGGMAGIAYNVADQNARESGMQALHSAGQVPPPPSRVQNSQAQRQPYPQAAGGYGYDYGYDSNSSLAAPGPAAVRGDSRSPSRSPHSHASGDPYVDDPYQGYSSTARGGDPNLGVVNPLEIEDDGDDGLDYPRQSQRNSMLSNSDRGARPGVGAATAVGGAAVAGGVLGRSGKLISP
jgi:hypothetical protein